MSSLAAFLDRRKKSTVKAAALLVQTEESAQDQAKASAGPEDSPSELPSDHDDEWKVSEDESTEAYRKQAETSENLLMTIRTIAADGSDERGTGNENKTTQHSWQNLSELVKPPESPKSEQEKDDGSKVWVPKFRSGGGKGSAFTKEDVDLVEAARILGAKHEVSSSKKNKKFKKKSEVSEVTAGESDPDRLVKIKFNVFSMVDEKYHSFKLPKGSAIVDPEKVKSKYIARPVYTEAA